MGDPETDEQGPVTRVRTDRAEHGHEWHGRRDGAHEQPEMRRHELPGTIPVGAYRIYHHDGRWRYDDAPLATGGDTDLLVTDEWLTYAVDAREAGPHDVTLRVAAADGFGGGGVGIAVDGKPRTQIRFDPTGGWDRWGEVTARVDLSRGAQTIRLVVLEGGWKLDRIRVT
ncbi:carbohydrate-binding protein [Halomicroarcula sp. S1AR25-4]|uniref:carbohydrate-binding protein n=1 Tax=Haloarcula sp. S1AR25-4 TaxID=2950538 RepID=UPI0028752486|nr:carbohydrate-binding protein [Halomicroarcula sp. S1AR25-4]MDS0278639.1 carbohydrate-binding protein [Halomicroarcula sp. S1AR25-4]